MFQAVATSSSDRDGATLTNNKPAPPKPKKAASKSTKKKAAVEKPSKEKGSDKDSSSVVAKGKEPTSLSEPRVVPDGDKVSPFVPATQVIEWSIIPNGNLYASIGIHGFVGEIGDKRSYKPAICRTGVATGLTEEGWRDLCGQTPYPVASKCKSKKSPSEEPQ